MPQSVSSNLWNPQLPAITLQGLAIPPRRQNQIVPLRGWRWNDKFATGTKLGYFQALQKFSRNIMAVVPATLWIVSNLPSLSHVGSSNHHQPCVEVKILPPKRLELSTPQSQIKLKPYPKPSAITPSSRNLSLKAHHFALSNHQ